MKKYIVLSIVFITFFGFAFANGINESNENFNSLDLSTASVDKIINTFNADVVRYENQKTILQTTLNETFEEGDIEQFFQVKDMISAIQVPSISQEQTETLVSRMEAEGRSDANDKLASFLAEKSLFYRPGIIFEYSIGDTVLTKHCWEKVGDIVTPPSVKGKGIFVGWTIDGENVVAREGESIEISYGAVTYKAKFRNGISFYDEKTGIDVFTEGVEADIPEVKSKSENDFFIGWYDEKGNRLDEEKATTEIGNSINYKGYWETLSFSDASVQYYENGKIPAHTEVKVFFTVQNDGELPITGATIKVESNNMSIISTDSLKLYLPKNGTNNTAYFIVKAEGNIGETASLKATVTDKNGAIWTKEYFFEIQ